jgi:hypothetical protein
LHLPSLAASFFLFQCIKGSLALRFVEGISVNRCQWSNLRIHSLTNDVFLEKPKMYKLLFAILSVLFLQTELNAQTEKPRLIEFSLKNSSLLPKKITIISYQPGDEGNGTEQVTMLPKSAKKLTFREGTKVYLADTEQVGVVMSGKRIDQDKPFLVVRKEDAGKTFPY